MDLRAGPTEANADAGDRAPKRWFHHEKDIASPRRRYSVFCQPAFADAVHQPSDAKPHAEDYDGLVLRPETALLIAR
jgi:hypothetical protein